MRNSAKALINYYRYSIIYISVAITQDFNRIDILVAMLYSIHMSGSVPVKPPVEGFSVGSSGWGSV